MCLVFLYGLHLLEIYIITIINIRSAKERHNNNSTLIFNVQLCQIVVQFDVDSTHKETLTRTTKETRCQSVR